MVQNRHRTSAYFRSAAQVQRKSILSAALLMSPPTDLDQDSGSCTINNNVKIPDFETRPNRYFYYRNGSISFTTSKEAHKKVEQEKLKQSVF